MSKSDEPEPMILSDLFKRCHNSTGISALALPTLSVRRLCHESGSGLQALASGARLYTGVTTISCLGMLSSIDIPTPKC